MKMKMTIYVPDDLADELSQRPGLNTSAVCQEALREAVVNSDRGFVAGAFTRIEDVSFTVHWMEPDRIVMKTGDRRVVNPASAKGEGLWFSASSNPDSADFHPINFNRFAYILEAADKPHPEPVELRQRQLDRRWAMLSPQMQAKILRAIERDRGGQ
jgi:hypothetical protein